mmetsp:Transcript_54121/g.130482  ORF Transcript_54121/g.130482 Transcript_54121/m.130482 type:complete len:360 (+) Transcript_54121:322-1401(+)
MEQRRPSRPMHCSGEGRREGGAKRPFLRPLIPAVQELTPLGPARKREERLGLAGVRSFPGARRHQGVTSPPGERSRPGAMSPLGVRSWPDERSIPGERSSQGARRLPGATSQTGVKSLGVRSFPGGRMPLHGERELLLTLIQLVAGPRVTEAVHLLSVQMLVAANAAWVAGLTVGPSIQQAEDRRMSRNGGRHQIGHAMRLGMMTGERQPSITIVKLHLHPTMIAGEKMNDGVVKTKRTDVGGTRREESRRRRTAEGARRSVAGRKQSHRGAGKQSAVSGRRRRAEWRRSDGSTKRPCNAGATRSARLRRPKGSSLRSSDGRSVRSSARSKKNGRLKRTSGGKSWRRSAGKNGGSTKKR